jgi:hypothetical protein
VSDRFIARYIQSFVAAVDGRFLDFLSTVYPNLANDIMKKLPISTNFQHPNSGALFLPIAVLIHAHSWFYYGNFQDPIYYQSGISQGHENHRHMIMYMVNHGTIITSAKRLSKLLLQSGIQNFVNPRFPVETSNVDDDESPSVSSSDGDDSSDNDDGDDLDDDLFINRSTVPSLPIRSSPTTIRSSTTLLQTNVPDVPQPTVKPLSIPVPFPTSSSTFNRHEKAATEDDNIAPVPNTPLTPATQRDHVKQDVKSLLHELGVFLLLNAMNSNNSIVNSLVLSMMTTVDLHHPIIGHSPQLKWNQVFKIMIRIRYLIPFKRLFVGKVPTTSPTLIICLIH